MEKKVMEFWMYFIKLNGSSYVREDCGQQVLFK